MLITSDLRCEYATDPLGIGTAAPRLSWKLTHPERDQGQTAYQVIAARHAEALVEGGDGLAWDSGKVASSDSVAVAYGGLPLVSRERIYWRVRCWDRQDRPGPWSEIAWFEAALLHPDDWKADWIGYPAGWPGRALYFRRQFTIDKPIDRARLYVTGLGYHELFLFNRYFWDEQVGGYGINNQSCNCFALWLGLVPADRQVRVVGNLLRAVQEHDYHLTTGNVCTKYLLEALSANGYADVALKIAAQTTYPSWGYMLANGATTLWERWELYTGHGMNSHDHPMMGSVSSWFYKALAGIRTTPQTRGFDHFELRPCCVAGLDHAAAEHQTIRGKVESAWRREGGRLTLRVAIPVNCCADVAIPIASQQARIWESGTLIWDGQNPREAVVGVAFLHAAAAAITFRVGSGSYEFSVEL